MVKWIGLLGILTLLFAIADIIHGQHNGDAHRVIIHAGELTCFIPFLCLLQLWTFFAIDHRYKLNRALVLSIFSFAICILAFLLFALSGGSFHGDGGPIAVTFLFMFAVSGCVLFPISIFIFFVSVIIRLRKRLPLLAR